MVKVSDFQNLRASATRVRIENAAQENASPVRTGPTSWSLGGRMVARVKEWFGAGKAQNTHAGLALINAVQQEYGTDAANTVRDQLKNRALQGKPLSARRVNISLDLARQNSFVRISANVTGDFGNVTGLRSDAGLRREDCRDGCFLPVFDVS